MREVIYLDKQENEKPVEFTHFLCGERGWTDSFCDTFNQKKATVTYLGKCNHDGDMFMVKDEGGHIDIFKGHLNSGKY